MIYLRLDDSRGASPMHRQICDQIQYQIARGEIETGTLLPPTRDLARQLGIARGTVVRAYEELCTIGVCQSNVGRGTEVIGKAAAKQPASTAKRKIAPPPDVAKLVVPDEPWHVDPRALSLLPSLADTEHLPISELRRGFDRVLRYPSKLRAFGESAGDPGLRAQIVTKLLPQRGIEVTPDEVMVVPGSQYGAVLVAMTLMSRRKRLHYGCPGYLDIARNFARFGYQLTSHNVDAEGLNLHGTELGAKDVLYLMPEHHFPQCSTLSNPRRTAITDMIATRNLLVIEDDYDSEYYYDKQPKPALKGGAHGEGVIYLSTFSKTLFNSLRLGYIVANRELIRELASLHWSLSRGTSGLLQRWVAELLEQDTLQSHIRRMRNVYRRKRDRIAAILARDFPAWSFTKPQGGLQFFIELGCPDAASLVMKVCAARGIRLASPSNYVMEGACSASFIVLGFGSSSLRQIETALAEVRKALMAT